MSKPGLLNRKPGNFEPQETFEYRSTDILSPNPSSSAYKNQNSSIKISSDLKEKLDAIKMLKKLKFDYEVISLLIKTYENNMDMQNYKKYQAFLDF